MKYNAHPLFNHYHLSLFLYVFITVVPLLLLAAAERSREITTFDQVNASCILLLSCCLFHFGSWVFFLHYSLRRMNGKDECASFTELTELISHLRSVKCIVLTQQVTYWIQVTCFGILFLSTTLV